MLYVIFNGGLNMGDIPLPEHSCSYRLENQTEGDENE